MTHRPFLTRRDVVKSAALTALAVPLASWLPAAFSAESSAPPPGGAPQLDRTHGIKFGVATISLESEPVETVITVLKQLEIGYASLFRTHAPFEKGTPEACRLAAEKFRAGGITPSTTSVVNLTNDEILMRHAFENVRAAGLTLMTCRPTLDSLPLAERFAREYDIRLAIHNHGPEDVWYPSPNEAFQAIQSLDTRIGLCLDVGHSMRARVDPAEAIRRCAPRLFDVHLKDSFAIPGAKTDLPTEVGRGQLDIQAILRSLVEIRYAGVVAFEYERRGVNPMIGLAESVGFSRGIAATL
jgi:inosose dehydratase